MISFKRLLKSFTYAFRGLAKVFREEQNLRIQSAVAILAFAGGLFLGLSRLEWVALVFASLLVFLMEITNSAVERITDLFKPRINTYVKEIKDIMAAAVMLSSIGAVLVGLLVFGPYLIHWLLAGSFKI
jgi:diacylglycerol kinase